MEDQLLSDMKFSRFLLVGKQIDPLMPTDPVSVHIMLRLLQVYRGLGKDAYTGLELLKQDTDLSDAICLDSVAHLSMAGLVEVRDNSAFRLTVEGLVRAANIEDLRERCLRGALDEQFPGLKYEPKVQEKPRLSLTLSQWLTVGAVLLVVLVSVFS